MTIQTAHKVCRLGFNPTSKIREHKTQLKTAT
jgi:hypothetical protein